MGDFLGPSCHFQRLMSSDRGAPPVFCLPMPCKHGPHVGRLLCLQFRVGQGARGYLPRYLGIYAVPRKSNPPDINLEVGIDSVICTLQPCLLCTSTVTTVTEVLGQLQSQHSCPDYKCISWHFKSTGAETGAVGTLPEASPTIILAANKVL